jgi:hypothetical protein
MEGTVSKAEIDSGRWTERESRCMVTVKEEVERRESGHTIG